MPKSNTTPQAARRPGRRPKIDRQQVIDAAVHLAESEGLDAVSLRAVAAQLDVGLMTLYGHVQGIEELVDLVVAEVFERWMPDVEWPPASDWEATLTLFARSRRAMLLEHPVMLGALQRHAVFTSRLVHDAERVFTALSAAGLDDDAALDAWVTLHAFVYGFVSVEQARTARHLTDERMRAERDRIREAVSSAPDDFPTLLRGVGEDVPWAFTDRQFDRSLRRLVADLGRAGRTRHRETAHRE